MNNVEASQFALANADAAARLAKLIREKLDLVAMSKEAGLDIQNLSGLTVEVEPAFEAFRRGDGKGCVTICIGHGPFKVCWKNCDD